MPNTVADLLDLDLVRNVLTVSESDLPMAVLQGYGLEDDLAIDLDQRVDGWEDLSTPKQLRLLRGYIKYRAAAMVAETAPLFVLKKETDGSNEGQRSDKDGFLWVSARMNARANEILGQLQDDMGVETPTGFYDPVSRLIPGRDPIVEPRGTS